MLVLTTMFINVSNNLPKTSYVKMIDIWLIFNLLLPFIEVLVHTYMDSLRFKQNPSFVKTIPRNDEDREINHHGRPVEVGEAESRPESSAKVPFKYFPLPHCFSTLLYPSLCWSDDCDQNKEPMIDTKII